MKKYLVLIGSVLIQTCLGGIYAWSAFVPALRDDYGLTTGQTQVIFGLCVALFIVAMVFAGRLEERKGPRLTASIGGVLFAVGYAVASFSGGAFAPLLLGIGVITGVGLGFAYVCPIASCVRWFPAKKGLVTGVAVAGFGGGAILLSQVANALFARGWDVLAIFRGVGIVYGAVIVVGALMLSCPGEAPGTAPPERTPLRTLLGSGRFWVLWFGMFSGTFAGLMVIGNLKPIGLAGAVPAAAATLAISTLAVGNAAGRIAWGFISDRIGGKAMPLSLAGLAVATLALWWAARSGTAFVVAAPFVGFGFGACLVLYAAATADAFGHENVGRNYPFVSLAYGFSGILGPAVGGILFDAAGSYTFPLVLAAALATVGALVLATVGRKVKVV
jgi:OFA family oxalate/formate antiporter-like MFS transporter